MSSETTAVAVFVCLFASIWSGAHLHRLFAEQHLDGDTKDAVKLAMGLVATMAALLLGLLVSSAKSDYDRARSSVAQIVGKVVFADRVLALYGSDAASARVELRTVARRAMDQLWREEEGNPAEASSRVQAGDELYRLVQALPAGDDMQRAAKAQALSLLTDIGELRVMLLAQSVPSISTPLLVVVVLWLVVIFVGFSVVAPSNLTSKIALTVSALSVAGAIFLILELDRPFGGLIQISREPVTAAMSHLGT